MVSLTAEKPKSTVILQIGNPYMTVNGIEEEIDEGKGRKPEIIGGRTMIPVRVLFETMGATIEWQEEQKKVVIKLDSSVIELQLENNIALVNGAENQCAAISERVDTASLLHRGVRLGTPSLYKSSFKKDTDDDGVQLEIRLGIEWENDQGSWEYSVSLQNPLENPKPSWQYHSEKLVGNGQKIINRNPESTEIK